MDFNTIGSISAIVIGLSALGISIWQGMETRKSFRISVKPKLILECNYVVYGPNPGISLCNKGIGPAVIQRIVYSYNNSAYQTNQIAKLIQKIVSEKFSDIDLCQLQAFIVDTETIIPATNHIVLFALAEEDRNLENYAILNKILNLIQVDVDYKSLYNEPFHEHLEFPLLLEDDGYVHE